MSKTTWTINVEEDPISGEMILPLNNDILKASNLREGDTVDWINRGDGSWEIRKVESTRHTEWVLVECTATYRMRYMVEVPEGKAEWALDTVTMKEAKEFSQEYLGEQIFSHRVVTKEEALDLCDKDNTYGSSWPEEIKIKNFFTKEGEKAEY
jgi:hypothetical protein